MTTPTPRRPLARPKQSIVTTPAPLSGLTPPSPSSLLARKHSLNQLTSNSELPLDDADKMFPPTTPGAGAGAEGGGLEVGDLVDVPGGMYGTVRFIGKVLGKAGSFAGVELAREFAARGKNDGEVDGNRYFTPSVSNAGIFLPLSRASKRMSPPRSSNGPTTPPGSAAPQHTSHSALTPPTPSIPSFSQSMGPGRSQSPQHKIRPRQSLPRPESPARKLMGMSSGRPSIGTATPGRAPPSRLTAPSPTPGRLSTNRLRSGSQSTSNDPNKRSVMTPKPTAKRMGLATIQSPMGPDPRFDADETDSKAIGVARTSDGSHASAFSAKNSSDEVDRLRKQLEERDKQLKEQAASLSDMETSLTELQSMINGPGDRSNDDVDLISLRHQVREKNEKISMLMSEFDSHRADFRSTIDTLELASTETVRVYEKRIDDLLVEVRELQDRNEDVEVVVQQLKILEEQVQGLEEGLEDARRSEAEARGEVEFLRGEVERGRAELRREREKAAAALKGAGAAVGDTAPAGGAKEVEQRDDEIRGLKAIIHSLSRDAVPDTNSPGKRRSTNSQMNGQTGDDLSKERQARASLERRVRELEGLVERKSHREEELERDLDRMRGQPLSASQRISSGFSEKASNRGSKRDSGRDSKGTIVNWRHQNNDNTPLPPIEATAESDTYSSDHDGLPWCELCETTGHDILTCTSVFGKTSAVIESPKRPTSKSAKDVATDALKPLAQGPADIRDHIAPLSPAKKALSPNVTPKAPAAPKFDPNDSAPVPGKESGVINKDFWCALCEKDGHESVDCPFEDGF